ncbi:MAG: cysteinyl-tRNA synthetase, partial [Gammaproteobacteria bacterium]|nr:cysteinyl-tRNA synthetase [Gammaproteobacteria bacterium]
MPSRKGIIALMGSGELTSTMVEVHKELLAGLVDSPQAVFLDTPAGFELNVDQISQRALEFFRIHVGHPLSVASYKSNESAAPYEAEQAFQKLREANFVLIGPGSPTYAVRQWQQTPIPKILIKRIEEGGCLVAASAAALTVGRFTLPVYEIYKVGENLHWVEGMNILDHFGFNLVVIPHWNNAEGGTHDTRFCYMGEPRLRQLESLLPE